MLDKNIKNYPQSQAIKPIKCLQRKETVDQIKSNYNVSDRQKPIK